MSKKSYVVALEQLMTLNVGVILVAYHCLNDFFLLVVGALEAVVCYELSQASEISSFIVVFIGLFPHGVRPRRRRHGASSSSSYGDSFVIMVVHDRYTATIGDVVFVCDLHFAETHTAIAHKHDAYTRTYV